MPAGFKYYHIQVESAIKLEDNSAIGGKMENMMRAWGLVYGVVILNKVIRLVLIEKVTFEQRLRGEQVDLVDI